jgi:adenylosuccinate synthase
MINGVTKIIMTKADVLDAFKDLQVCTAYEINGKETSEVPFQMTRVKIKPVYKEFAGWNTNTEAAKSLSDLPDKMKIYVDYINKYLGVNVNYVSNGPGRDQIVLIP